MIGNKEAGNPFDSRLLDLNEAQLDFILEMFVSEDKNRGKFVRPGKETTAPSQQNAAWEHVLTGKARERFMSRFKVSDAVRARINSLHKAADMLLKKGKK